MNDCPVCGKAIAPSRLHALFHLVRATSAEERGDRIAAERHHVAAALAVEDRGVLDRLRALVDEVRPGP